MLYEFWKYFNLNLNRNEELQREVEALKQERDDWRNYVSPSSRLPPIREASHRMESQEDTVVMGPSASLASAGHGRPLDTTTFSTRGVAGGSATRARTPISSVVSQSMGGGQSNFAPPPSASFFPSPSQSTPASIHKIGKVLAEASKIVKIKLTFNSDVILFLDNLGKLERAVEDLYGAESERLKIQIGLNQCDERCRTDGDVIYESYKAQGVFDFSEFLKDLFKLNFPAPQSSLDIGFQTLSQNYPVKSTIVDYARRFRSIVGLLELRLDKQGTKFINGLASAELKMTLRRNDIENLNFDQLVALAVSLSNRLAQDKDKGSRVQWVTYGGDEDECYLICNQPANKYFTAARAKGVEGRCFNCLGLSHKHNECRLRSCKFCDKPIKTSGHLSLLCPKAPKSFDKFIEKRTASKKPTDEVRFAEDFEDYLFDSDELSD